MLLYSSTTELPKLSCHSEFWLTTWLFEDRPTPFTSDAVSDHAAAGTFNEGWIKGWGTYICDGSAMGRRWVGDGSAMGRRWLLLFFLSNNFNLQVFLNPSTCVALILFLLCITRKPDRTNTFLIHALVRNAQSLQLSFLNLWRTCHVGFLHTFCLWEGQELWHLWQLSET